MHREKHSLSAHETGKSIDSHSRAYSIDIEQTPLLAHRRPSYRVKQREPNTNKQPQRGILLKPCGEPKPKQGLGCGRMMLVHSFSFAHRQSWS